MSSTAISNLNGSRVTVMGLGRFGGGVGVTRFLADRGAAVTVTDLGSADRLADSIAQIQPWVDQGKVTLRLGEHDKGDFAESDLVVASPAVPKPWMNEFLLAAESAEVPITTEIGLLVELLGDPSRIVGVTGSAGKSTVSAMAAHAIKGVLHARGDHREVHLGGNIGGSLLGSIDSIAPDDLVVLELSSAMLYWLGRSGWSPGIAVVTNLSENHLDWHGNMEHYEQSKRAITDNQREYDAALLPAALSHWSDRATVVDPANQGTNLASLRLQLPGVHNKDNAQLAAHAAVSVLQRAGVDVSVNACAQALASFKALPHRLELVAERGALCAYNDSKSTTPESALGAVEAMLEDDGARSIYLICGGSDKGAAYGPLVEAGRRCARVYTIGSTGPAIAAALRSGEVDVAECGELAAAVRSATAGASGDGVILLSPACASYDQFESYVERGEVFSRLAREEIANRSKTEKISK